LRVDEPPTGLGTLFIGLATDHEGRFALDDHRDDGRRAELGHQSRETLGEDVVASTYCANWRSSRGVLGDRHGPPIVRHRPSPAVAASASLAHFRRPPRVRGRANAGTPDLDPWDRPRRAGQSDLSRAVDPADEVRSASSRWYASLSSIASPRSSRARG
jgi:hypothetical protein